MYQGRIENEIANFQKKNREIELKMSLNEEQYIIQAFLSIRSNCQTDYSNKLLAKHEDDAQCMKTHPKRVKVISLVVCMLIDTTTTYRHDIEKKNK